MIPLNLERLLYKARKIIGGDSITQPVPESRRDGPIHDVPAHRSRAVNLLTPASHRWRSCAGVLGAGQAALIALPLEGRRTGDRRGRWRTGGPYLQVHAVTVASLRPYRRSGRSLARRKLPRNAVLLTCLQRHPTDCSGRLLKPSPRTASSRHGHGHENTQLSTIGRPAAVAYEAKTELSIRGASLESHCCQMRIHSAAPSGRPASTDRSGRFRWCFE